jgi:pSer/pThr/pTyr-binding forkhead associated (FHA) protein
VHDEGPEVMTINDHDGTTVDIADEPTSAIPRPVLGDRDSSLGPQKQSSMAAVEFVPPGAATLVISRGPNSGHKFLLDQPVMTVGRHRRSAVFLDDITVSRRHAELQWTNGEVRVVDVGSLNGSYVNGQAVESTVLVHGDELQFGKFRLTFVAASASESAEAAADRVG